jgi:hypothetical protein
MGLAYLREVAGALAIGRGEPRALRAELLSALARLGIDLPGAEPMSDDELLTSDAHTLLAFVDDHAGQCSLRILADDRLPALVQAALERANGMAAAGPADVAPEEVGPVLRVLGLAGTDPDPDGWLADADRDDPETPTAEEIAALSQVAPVAYVVVNDDGSLWSHGPAPAADLLRRRFSRVVSFNLAM